MSLESPSLPPAGAAAISASPPRSKLDFLFQEMLIESGRTADRNAQIAAQLDQVALIARGLPAQLRQASAEAAAEVATSASRSLSEAARSLSKADWDLRVTVGALAGVNLRNAWRIGILCAGSSFIGTVLGTFVVQFILA
ncbi:hypothetical protein ACOTBW_29695 [Achromobacter dolens]|uniref:hypothetical protein n=2 Tax=Achromobacter dolens TaxID=1287738 RepID=UPI003558E6B1